MMGNDIGHLLMNQVAVRTRILTGPTITIYAIWTQAISL